MSAEYEDISRDIIRGYFEVISFLSTFDWSFWWQIDSLTAFLNVEKSSAGSSIPFSWWSPSSVDLKIVGLGTKFRKFNIFEKAYFLKNFVKEYVG